jgi:hypothetical protein
MEAFEKVIELYKYTKALVELKYSVVSDISKQIYMLSINSVPEYEHYTERSFRDYVETDDILQARTVTLRFCVFKSQNSKLAPSQTKTLNLG